MTARPQERKTLKQIAGNIKAIDINDYYYNLPDELIAQHPVAERDQSQLLVYKGNTILKDTFSNLDKYLPSDSLLVFNNSRVIRARLLFKKDSGAGIEILCLEPLTPCDYTLSFSSTSPVEWKCIIGNLKKWKSGDLSCHITLKGTDIKLIAEKIRPEGEAWRIRFSWNSGVVSFAEVIEAAGHIPLPPYMNRDDTAEDTERYQTVYSKVNGSVAAPTAGLHFTENIFGKIKSKGIKSAEVTLHVGAGTFQPIKTISILDHEMHSEHFIIDARTIVLMLENNGKIIPVGTTSVRTLESIYWLGVKILQNPPGENAFLSLGQWEPYELPSNVSVKESLNSLLNLLKERNTDILSASTGIIIVPGYEFRLIDGMITNFHQPRSTLLLLISAWTGNKWKEIYRFAIKNRFRFLSYGDCSLLLK